jgi:hypothetical protein
MHLGDRVTPLVDGQLPVDAAERAYAHLAICRQCRARVEEERLIKSRLAALRDPVPDQALMSRLVGLAAPGGPMAPRDGHVPGSPRPQTVPIGHRPLPDRPGEAGGGSSRPPGRRPLGRARGARRPRVKVAAAMVGALSLLGAGVVAGVAAAGSPAGPALVPPVDSFVVEHQATTANFPFIDDSSGWGETPVKEAGR